MSLLRFYPPAERDESGVPLDWWICRACDGEGRAKYPDRGLCTECRGCRSARELILSRDVRVNAETNVTTTLHGPRDERDVLRCETCSHPMDPGLWSPTVPEAKQAAMTLVALKALVADEALPDGASTHYSPCDVQCTHGGRTFAKGGKFGELPEARRYTDPELRFSAFREIDARTLREPHDLRPANVAVLCLSCYAASGTAPPLGALDGVAERLAGLAS